MSDDHSPTPWRFDANDVLRDYEAERVDLKAAANAPFIVKAVNLHAELVEFVRQVRQSMVEDTGLQGTDAQWVVEHADELLAKALAP